VSELPSGTLTFLFTDVNGSTALVQDDVRDGNRRLIEAQDTVRSVLAREGGHEVHCAGDGFFFVFSSALDAVRASLQVQEQLDRGIRVRIGMHTGHAVRWNGEYMGIDVHRAARIAAAAHGGQVLMSRSTRELVACEVIDLGQHTLRDIAEPIHLYQAGTKPFAPLASGDVSMPASSTAFVGRERELVAVGRLLGKEGVRLVTLTGPGGIGKTRLALELVRRRAERYPDGRWWIDLAAVGDSRLVPEIVAKATGARADAAQFIGTKSCLLVLDNFEHLPGAAGFVGDLLRRCENLRVIVTSRSSLRLASEWRFAVEPLADQDAVALFCTRALAAGAVVRKSEHIAAICRRVDNIPLALELAAAKSVLLSPSELLSRLEGRLCDLGAAIDDVPQRHRTLRATVQWSYELLGMHERAHVCGLAVFTGGWSLEAARAVSGADADIIEDLIKKSFVRVADGRFHMLELIREFGLEQLDADTLNAAQVRRCHRDYFLRLVERHHEVQSASPMNWRNSFQELELEHENIHAALLFSMHSSEGRDGHVAALRFCAALRLYWTSRWHCREGLRVCLLALAGRRIDSNRGALAGTLWAAASLSTFAGDLHRASSFYEEALALFKELRCTDAEAMVISDFGHLSYLLGDFDTAKSRFDRLARLAAEADDEKLTANAHYGIARVALAQKDGNVAREHLELALAGYVKVGHRSNQSLALLYQGVLALSERDFTAAERLLSTALSLAREAGEAMDESCILRCLGDVKAASGNFAEARELLRDSLLSNVDSDDMLEVALGLRSAAMLSFREGNFSHGATWAGAALRAGERVERLLAALMSQEEHGLVDAARRALGKDFDVLERKGVARGTRDAIEDVLRQLKRKPSGGVHLGKPATDRAP
jgi:predicted ATPase